MPQLPLAKAPGPLVNKDGAVGQERHAPGLNQSFGDHQVETAFDAGVEGHRRVGQQGRIRFTGDTGFMGEATIVRRGRMVEDRSRTVPFWAELKTPPPAPLLPGMLARVTLILSEPPPTLAVPRNAILEEGTLRYLFVRRADDTFERRLAETGRGDDRFVQITRGLSEGELVAVAGVAELQTGYAAIQ